jgi:hypothetical protein
MTFMTRGQKIMSGRKNLWSLLFITITDRYINRQLFDIYTIYDQKYIFYDEKLFHFSLKSSGLHDP